MKTISFSKKHSTRCLIFTADEHEGKTSSKDYPEKKIRLHGKFLDLNEFVENINHPELETVFQVFDKYILEMLVDGFGVDPEKLEFSTKRQMGH